MAGLFETYATNRKAEVEGVLIDIGGGIKFRLARRTRANKRYTKALDVATKPHAVALEKETISPELSDEIMLNVFCETILLDWEGIKYDERMGTLSPPPDTEGNVPFSVFNAKQLMTLLPDLYDDLSRQSQKQSLFREAQDSADTKA